MAAKDLLGKLPSLQELLDHPRVRDAAQRWNRSEALSRVRAAVDDLGAEVSRRAEDWSGASPSELLERLLGRLDRSAPLPASPVINATGELWGPDWIAAPLADPAIEQLARGGCPGAVADPSSAIAGAVGAEAAVVLASPARALHAAISSVGPAGGAVVVAKSEAAPPATGCSLAKLVESADKRLLEVGGPGGATVEEYAAALAGEQEPLLLRRTPEFHRVEGSLSRLTTGEAHGLATTHRATLVEDLGGGCPAPPPTETGVATPSVQGALADGADLVVLSGTGLVGGPHCGVTLGRRSAIDVIRTHGSADLAGLATVAALVATLDLFAEPSRLRFAHPLWRLLDTPLENLRVRAERLAPLLETHAAVEAAEPIEIGAEQAVGPIGVVRLPSFGVALTGDHVHEALSAADPEVIARRQPIDGKVVLDLRTMPPSDDLRLAERLGEDPASN